MTVAKRLGLGFGSVIAIGAGLAIFATAEMRNFSAGLDDIVNNKLVNVEHLNVATTNLTASA